MTVLDREKKDERLKQELCLFDERQIKEQNILAAGVDEVGRGPLAGPVVAAAVILFRPHFISKINDSKKIASSKRKKIFLEIAKHGIIGIGVANEKIIDEINIYEASRLAMKRAVLQLSRTPELLLIDGNMKIDLPIVQKSIIRGDQKSASIAAASIIAKVYRDAWMEKLHDLYPDYLFCKHKGYPTKEHIKRLGNAGISPVHRKSFGPVKTLLEKSKTHFNGTGSAKGF